MTGEIDAKTTRLLGLLRRTEKITEARVDRALQPALTCAQYHALMVLIRAGEPLSLGQIAERSHSVRSNATQMIDRLEAEGLVERVLDPTDRRRVLAQITQEGRRRYNTAAQAILKIEQELLEHFSDDERDQLTSLLSRLEQIWG